MSIYSEFFLNSKANVVQLETLEISHSAFSQTYYLIRNATQGITATDEDDNERFFEYCPMTLDAPEPKDDLDQILTVTLGDLGSIVAKEIKNVLAANAANEFPVCKYRTFRSDNLDAPLFGPLVLEIRKVPMKQGGASFQAKAPSLNTTRTGERYSIERFPMLAYLL
jgi:hypothetical protein